MALRVGRNIWLSKTLGVKFFGVSNQHGDGIDLSRYVAYFFPYLVKECLTSESIIPRVAKTHCFGYKGTFSFIRIHILNSYLF